MVGTITLTSNDLTSLSEFNPVTDLPPYNKLSRNMRGINLKGRSIGLKKLSLYYSWPNIISTTSMTVGWKVGASFTNFTWTLPALRNYASISDLNKALQTFCQANGLYLIDGDGNYVYYLELMANASSYKIDLSLYLVPTSLPAGWTAPGSFAGYPTVTCTPRLVIPSNSELSNLIGFTAGTYDGAAATSVFSSTYIPQLSPVSSIFISCNFAKNDVPINGTTVIGSFTSANTVHGSIIELEPNEITHYEIDGSTDTLEVAFYDQNFRPLYIMDPQITVLLEVV
jgi:hypothetical protein